jgi:hypothetical protein
MSKFICGICTAAPAMLGAFGLIGAVVAPVFAAPGCMTMEEARKAFPRDHIYWHGPRHCWDNNAKKRALQSDAKSEPKAGPPDAAAIDAAGAGRTKPAPVDAAGAPAGKPPARFFVDDPTASLFWPIRDAPARVQQSDPPPAAAPAPAPKPEDQDDIVIGAPNAAPGSPDYLLDHCCWPPSLSRGRREAGVLRNMIIASTGASGLVIGLWLLIERRRRMVRVSQA